MIFSELSNEAKLLLVIGEPLRNVLNLSDEAWLVQIWAEWKRVTQKGQEEFIAAFEQLSILAKPPGKH